MYQSVPFIQSYNAEMTEILSQQYSSVFSKPKQVDSDSASLGDGPKLSDINFTTEDIENAIKELKSNAAAGPDGFPAILLKKCSTQLAVPLTILWRKCLGDGFIPP